MTQEEIIRMAREAGLIQYVQVEKTCVSNALERFSSLVAAHEREKTKAVFEELEREVKTELINAINGAVELEREACARVCDEEDDGMPNNVAQSCAAAIRKRSNPDKVRREEQMKDRELLELAAKSAGIYIQFPSSRYHPEDQIPRLENTLEEWNPLTDDGDALRLAVKLGLWLQTRTEENCGDNPYAATRRAIVRAAAEIGKCMK